MTNTTNPNDPKWLDFVEWAQRRWGKEAWHHTINTCGEWDAWNGALEQQAAQIDALRADAERYRWLRMRLKVREERSMSGSYKDSIYIRVAQSFFDTPTRGDDGYLDKSIFAKECCEFDAAIDAALRQEQPT